MKMMLTRTVTPPSYKHSPLCGSKSLLFSARALSGGITVLSELCDSVENICLVSFSNVLPSDINLVLVEH